MDDPNNWCSSVSFPCQTAHVALNVVYGDMIEVQSDQRKSHPEANSTRQLGRQEWLMKAKASKAELNNAAFTSFNLWQRKKGVLAEQQNTTPETRFATNGAPGIATN